MYNLLGNQVILWNDSTIRVGPIYINIVKRPFANNQSIPRFRNINHFKINKEKGKARYVQKEQDTSDYRYI